MVGFGRMRTFDMKVTNPLESARLLRQRYRISRRRSFDESSDSLFSAHP